MPAAAATSSTRGFAADALACRSASACAPANANSRRAPSSAVASDCGCQDVDEPFCAAMPTCAGMIPEAATYSSKSSASVPVPRFRTGADASAGAAPSGTVLTGTAARAGRSLPDTSRTAPAAAVLTDALPARGCDALPPRAPPTTSAFWRSDRTIATVSLYAEIDLAPPRFTRSCVPLPFAVAVAARGHNVKVGRIDGCGVRRNVLVEYERQAARAQVERARIGQQGRRRRVACYGNPLPPDAAERVAAEHGTGVPERAVRNVNDRAAAGLYGGGLLRRGEVDDHRVRAGGAKQPVEPVLGARKGHVDAVAAAAYGSAREVHKRQINKAVGDKPHL